MALPLDHIKELRQEGHSIRAIVGELADQGITVSAKAAGRILKVGV